MRDKFHHRARQPVSPEEPIYPRVDYDRPATACHAPPAPFSGYSHRRHCPVLLLIRLWLGADFITAPIQLDSGRSCLFGDDYANTANGRGARPYQILRPGPGTGGAGRARPRRNHDLPAQANGAGKTTAVRVLCTLLGPNAGWARVAGHDVRTESAAVRRRIGMAGQYAAVDECLTGRGNLVMIGRLSRIPRREARRRADELLAALDLERTAGRTIRTYSGGMRRRLDLAASLLGRPDVCTSTSRRRDSIRAPG